jgi:hypothetical protein
MMAAQSSLLHAQGVGGFGSSSSLGRSGVGSSAFGSSGIGSSSFGRMGSSFGRFGSSGFGSSAFGSGGFGSSSFGSGGFGGSGTFGSSGFGSGGFGNSTFGSNSGGQTFIGRDSGDMANVWSQLGQAGTQYFNQMNRAMSRSNTASTQQVTTNVEHVPQPMRIKLQVAFTPSRPSPAALEQTIQTRLGRILSVQNIVPPQVTMVGDVAVLQGAAASESQRLVLEKLVALEPGVRAVRNEMTVGPPSATGSLPATDRN